MQNRWDAINRFFHNKQNILITTHLNPDGDALGSEIALANFFDQKGVTHRIINADLTPAFFHFLDAQGKIEQYQADEHDPLLSSFDGCIVVDVSEYKRLGALCNVIRNAPFPVACIDHHIANGEFGDVRVIDNRFASTGELVYDFLAVNNARFTQEIVDALYTCILTDTGSFRFSNTTPLTHRIAADLIEKKARFEYIYSQLYESDSRSRTRLKGRLLADMQFECNDRFAWFVLSQALLKEMNAQLWETEGFSELPRVVKGVEISIMFTETEEGLAKASFRSRGSIPINDLAAQFGGGGHKFAAGAELNMPLEKAIPLLRQAAKQHLEKYTGSSCND